MGKESAEFVTTRPAAAEAPARRGVPIPLLVGTVIIGGLVFAQVQWGILDQLLSQRPWQIAGESPAAEQKLEKSPDKVGGNQVRLRKERPALAQVQRPIEAEAAAAPSQPAIPVRRFPTGSDIPAGTSAFNIRQAFGAPDMRMVDSEHGHSTERWVYMSRELSTVTTVILSDGRAVSAQSSFGR